MWMIIFFACLLPLQHVVLQEVHSEDSSQPSISSPSSEEKEEDPEIIPTVTCPPDKSLYNRKDIITLIDYYADSLLINHYINKSYFARAIAVRNKHMEDLRSFLAWIQNRPEHLKHVLKDITYIKNHIEQHVRKVADTMDEYSQLKQKYQKQSERTSELTKDINRFKAICENNCQTIQTRSSGLIAKNNEDSNYYCSSLEDLSKTISSNLLNFTQYYASIINKKLTYDDGVYTKDIGELKHNLKVVTLKEFGRTMYDILTLSDEYHHFIESLLRRDVKSEVYNIKDLSILIESELLELEHRVEKYGDYCRTCNNVPRNAYRNIFVNSPIDETQKQSTNIVDELLQIKYEEIDTEANKDYTTIFADLDSLLNSTDPTTVYSKDLKPIQDEVLEMLNKSKAELDELKSIIPQWSLNSLFILLADYQQLFLQIQSKNSDLMKFSN